MTLLELLRRRRSCRKFDGRNIEREVLERLLEGTLTAPSSKNTRSSRFAVIEDRELIAKISQMRTTGSSFVADAPLVIAVMGDATLSDMWRDNCAISATVMQLMAESLGLGSCWVHVNGRPHRDDNPTGPSAEDYLHQIMPQTAGYGIECVVALGYPAEQPRPRKETDDSDKVIYIG